MKSYSILLGILMVMSVDFAQSVNPFEGKELHVPFRYRKQVMKTIEQSSLENKRLLRPLRKVSTAFWISKKKILYPSLSKKGSFLSALWEAGSKSTPSMVTSVIYNLPNRDCAAESSTGEICCAKGSDGKCDRSSSGGCNSGILEYKTKYIDVIAKTVDKFCDFVPMAFIIEPDSIPNLVTNLGLPNCGSNSTMSSYKISIPYAVRALKKACPKVSIYLDAAHGNWLGWENNANIFVEMIKEMNITHLLRGFAINVSNYNPLGTKCPSVGFCKNQMNANHKCCRPDPCKQAKDGNPGFTELNYAEELHLKFSTSIKGFSPRFIIDTSRNGGSANNICKETWCNFRDAGLGIKSTAKTGNELIDAFLWVKPPTESDGCTEFLPNGQKCPRFDKSCAQKQSVGSLPTEPRVPEAGFLFQYQLIQLTKNGIQ